MSVSVASHPQEPRARKLEFLEDEFVVRLSDGRSLSVPLAWYPPLLNATKAQLQNYRLIGDGIGVHWPDLDEDLSVPRLFGLPC